MLNVQALFQGVVKYGYGKWSQIIKDESFHFNNRNNVELRVKFCTLRDKGIIIFENDKWSVSEIYSSVYPNFIYEQYLQQAYADSQRRRPQIFDRNHRSSTIQNVTNLSVANPSTTLQSNPLENFYDFEYDDTGFDEDYFNIREEQALASAELEPFMGGTNFQSTPTIAQRPVAPQFIAPVNNLNMAPSRPIAVAPHPISAAANYQSTPTIAQRPVAPQFIAPVNNLNMAPSRPIAVAPHPISAAANFQSTPTIAQRPVAPQFIAPVNNLNMAPCCCISSHFCCC
jgi:hypothetical protein